MPKSISNLSLLSWLYLYDNPGLKGTIPMSITGLSLFAVDFSGTYLCDPVDPAFDTWKAGVSCSTEGSCAGILFSDDFGLDDFSLWTRFQRR